MHGEYKFDKRRDEYMDIGESGNDSEVNTSYKDNTSSDSDTSADSPDARDWMNVKTSFPHLHTFSL